MVCFTQGNGGDVRQLTITANKAGGLGAPTTILMESEILPAGGARQRNFWATIVTQ
jgi:hypothetical protein